MENCKVETTTEEETTLTGKDVVKQLRAGAYVLTSGVLVGMNWADELVVSNNPLKNTTSKVPLRKKDIAELESLSALVTSFYKKQDADYQEEGALDTLSAIKAVK